MSKTAKTPPPKPLVDEYGNRHRLADELARGGQGVVFRTKDADLAIKQSLDTRHGAETNAALRQCFQNIRLLPLPPRIPVSLPLAILRDEPGYVMRLLNGMQPFSAFDLNGKTMRELREKLRSKDERLPTWLASVPDPDMALRLYHYANTGATRRRLFALSKCAAILARLHSAGLVYGDISPNNVFAGEGDSREVWLIDADNLRHEVAEGGGAVYTPHYGAPEVVRGCDQSRPRTDCWAFAVMAFGTLALAHPFIGKKVLNPDRDDGGWDAEPAADGTPADPDEQAYAGHLPFIDDEDDDANAASLGLPRVLVATREIRRLFQETLGAGRTQPHRRPAMFFWAIEMARAFDRSLVCPECRMSHFPKDHSHCPYCGAPRPAFAVARTPRWEMLISAEVETCGLPHRLFNPFSAEHNDGTEHEAVMDFAKKSARPVRGTNPFPAELEFEFVEAEK